MCIVFTCGEHTFRKEVEGYNGLVCRCYNCGNYSGSVIKSNPWFTFCFVVSQLPIVRACVHGPWLLLLLLLLPLPCRHFLRLSHPLTNPVANHSPSFRSR
jgi:hypothetical protein